MREVLALRLATNQLSLFHTNCEEETAHIYAPMMRKCALFFFPSYNSAAIGSAPCPKKTGRLLSVYSGCMRSIPSFS